MSNKLMAALCFLVAKSSPDIAIAPNNETLVASALQNCIKPVSASRPLAAHQKKGIAIGRNIVPPAVATDECSGHFFPNGKVSCRGVPAGTGHYQITGNWIITIVNTRTIEREFSKDADDRIYVRNIRSAYGQSAAVER